MRKARVVVEPKGDPTAKIAAVMLEFMPEARQVLKAFGFMTTAIELMAAAERAYPGIPQVHDAWYAIMPSPMFQEYAPPVYRSHASELLRRVTSLQAVKGGELDYGVLALATKAEVMVYISNATLASRLQSDVEGLYEYLFVQVFGLRAFQQVADGARSHRRESYPGAYLELLAQFQRRFAVERERPPQPTKAERAQARLDNAMEELFDAASEG